MKKILITGKNSYIGNSFEKWGLKEPEKYSIYKISIRDESWKQIDFSDFDVVLHVAGIAHIKETRKNQSLYFKINRDLAYEVAKKAKSDGVKHFIFMSTMSVYGLLEGNINDKTPLRPLNAYGKSKLEAEELIQRLKNTQFKVAVVRPPLVYGKESKGNYANLSKIAKIAPFFPLIDNKRSMIFVDNLCEFIKLLIDEEKTGLFYPQNEQYMCTSEIVELISKANNKPILITKKVAPFFLKLRKLKLIKKVFGDLIYETSLLDDYQQNQQHIVCDYKRSILKSEGVIE